MTQTTKKRRTAALITEAIQNRLTTAEERLANAEAEVVLSRARVTDIRTILADAKRQGGAEG